MCGPAAGIITSGLSTIMGMEGASATGSAQAASYDYQAQIAQQNASIMQNQAQQASIIGAQKAGTVYDKAEATKAAQVTVYGASGLDTSTGSPSQVIGDTQKLALTDKGNMLYDSANNVWNYQTAATNDLNQASADTAAASNAKSAGSFNEVATLLTGASSVANQFGRLKYFGDIGSAANTATDSANITGNVNTDFASGAMSGYNIQNPMQVPKFKSYF